MNNEERQRKLRRIKELTILLNTYRDEYYNNSESKISDFEYDNLFDELAELEKETDFYFCGSPTHTVGFTVLDKLPKSVHKYPMLSLDKTKKPEDLLSFVGDKEAILMFKMDGMTCAATYDTEGNLTKCESRGNGIEGSDITSNAMTFTDLPQKINHKGGLVVFGEAIIDYPTFYKVNESLSEKNKYKNPRNLCAGSVSLLDSKECAKRGVRFVAWRLVDGYEENSFVKRLDYLQSLGFYTVPAIMFNHDLDMLKWDIETGRQKANDMGLPTDGLVCGFDDVSYSESLGATSHHLRSQLAFKYGEDKEFTTLREVEWSMSKNSINPVAIFDTVKLAGTEVSRASLSNISIMKELNIKIGSQVEVCKRNEIIPYIESCDGNGTDVEIPTECPVCHAPTEIVTSDNGTQTLICTNPDCNGKLLSKLSHFVSKNCMNIEGLSESTLEKIMSVVDIKNFHDLYTLKIFKDKLVALDGLGAKSVEKLLSQIEDSKHVKMQNFLAALSIPLIGKTASKDISKHCCDDIQAFIGLMNENYDFTCIDGFGTEMQKSLSNWWKHNKEEFMTLVDYMVFDSYTKIDEATENKLLGKIFVITGSLEHFANRNELVAKIESLGGKVSGSVSAKTDYLINNDIESSSSKNGKAKSLNIPIISESDFLNIIGE